MRPAITKMSSLPVGAYEVTADKLGFRQQARRGITLSVAQEAVVNLTLDGEVAEQVTVTEEAPLVNATLSSTSGLITEQQAFRTWTDLQRQLHLCESPGHQFGYPRGFRHE
jgi:hypothetical protein